MSKAVDVSAVTVVHEGLTLLRPVTFSLDQGECAAVTGANGSGKTALLRVLAGTVAASGGTARIDGSAVDDRSVSYRRAVSALIGVPAYYEDLTLLDHLELLDRLWRGEASTAVFEELDMEFLAHRYPRELSSGQQQLFHLALALARPADVLILDEPEQRLDRLRRQNLAAILTRRKSAGSAIVLATHDAELAEAVATRVVHLSPTDEDVRR